MKVITYIEDKNLKIRFWMTKQPIVELPLRMILYSILGEDLTEEDYQQIFRLDSVYSLPDDKFSISMRNHEYMTVQRTPTYDNQRECNIFYQNGRIKHVRGGQKNGFD